MAFCVLKDQPPNQTTKVANDNIHSMVFGVAFWWYGRILGCKYHVQTTVKLMNDEQKPKLFVKLYANDKLVKCLCDEELWAAVLQKIVWKEQNTNPGVEK